MRTSPLQPASWRVIPQTLKPSPDEFFMELATRDTSFGAHAKNYNSLILRNFLALVSTIYKGSAPPSERLPKRRPSVWPSIRVHLPLATPGLSLQRRGGGGRAAPKINP